MEFSLEKSLRILHCSIFNTFKNGDAFYSMDRKITHGLIQNGHQVYEFSYRDIARAKRFLGFKKRSIQKMNQDLIETCENLEPDILLLGKSELISSDTLKKIKEKHKEIKIIQWYVDFIDKENLDFFKKFDYIDLFLQTTANGLKELSEKYIKTIFSYFPNISDPMFERNTNNKKLYDVLYIARDNKEDNRYKFAKLLDEFCKKENINLKMYGSLGNPLVFGAQYLEEISKSKIAINFNREDLLEDYNKNKILGTSDRMNHFLGMGTCTFSPKILDLDKLYKNNEEVIYFDNIEECFEKIKQHLSEKTYEKIGRKGQERSYKISNSKRVSKYILDLGIYKKLNDEYEWKDYVFKNGKKIKL